jgi:hypothetical protein
MIMDMTKIPGFLEWWNITSIYKEGESGSELRFFSSNLGKSFTIARIIPPVTQKEWKNHLKNYRKSQKDDSLIKLRKPTKRFTIRLFGSTLQRQTNSLKKAKEVTELYLQIIGLNIRNDRERR